MPIIKEPKVDEEKLVLGDYVTVCMSGSKSTPHYENEPCDIRVHREEFVRRIQKQRGEFFRRIQNRKGKLIDPRKSGVA